MCIKFHTLRVLCYVLTFLPLIDRQVSNDEEGRVALISPMPGGTHEGEEGRIALLDTEIPATRSIRNKKKSCCMCCGIEYVDVSVDL